MTDDTHLGLYPQLRRDGHRRHLHARRRWDIATHTIDYSDADALRMRPPTSIYAAQWSQANDFRLDQLFNGGGSVDYQNGDLD